MRLGVLVRPHMLHKVRDTQIDTAVSSEARAKLREWAVLAGKGRLLLSGSVLLASLKAV